MTTKEIWNKVHSLYSNESPLTTIHVDQRNKEDHQETRKDIWNKVQSLYSNESPLTTIHANQRSRKDQHEARKEATPNPSNEDQSNPEEELDELEKMKRENELLKEKLQKHKEEALEKEQFLKSRLKSEIVEEISLIKQLQKSQEEIEKATKTIYE